MLNPVFIIIGINLVVFIAANLSKPRGYGLGVWAPLELTMQQPWGIFTSMFTHTGFTHFLFNMLTLYFFGSYLLKLTGWKQFLIIYLGGGLLGSIFYVLLSTLISPDFPGLEHKRLGRYLCPRRHAGISDAQNEGLYHVHTDSAPLWIAVIGGGLILSFLPGLLGSAPGGLLFGLAAGLIIRRQKNRPIIIRNMRSL